MRTSIIPRLLQDISFECPDRYINNNEYICQRKYDGVRLMVQKIGNLFFYRNKKGEVIEKQLTDVEYQLVDISSDFIVDGEYVSEEKRYYVFDVIRINNYYLHDTCYGERYSLLCSLLSDTSAIEVVKNIDKNKLDLYNSKKYEGVVFKNLKSVGWGKSEDMVKYKFYKEITTQISSVNGNSANVITYNNDRTKHFCCKISLYGKKVKENDFVEVRYLYASKNKKFLIQPVIKMVRHDVTVSDCRTDKII